MTEIHPSKLEVTLIDHFPVSFGTEGDSISLVCSMVVVPNLPNLPPLAQWYRDGKVSCFSLNYGEFDIAHNSFYPQISCWNPVSLQRCWWVEEQPGSHCLNWPRMTRGSTPSGSSPRTALLNTAPTCLSQVTLTSCLSSAECMLSFLLCFIPNSCPYVLTP